MRGREFLETCALLATVPDEAAIRSRISRAYYAAYLEARTFCEVHLGYRRSRQGRELQDIPRLLRPIDNDVVSWLTFLRQLRNTADYDLDVSAPTMANSVAGAESFARNVIAALDRHTGRLMHEARGEDTPPT